MEETWLNISYPHPPVPYIFGTRGLVSYLICWLAWEEQVPNIFFENWKIRVSNGAMSYGDNTIHGSYGIGNLSTIFAWFYIYILQVVSWISEPIEACILWLFCVSPNYHHHNGWLVCGLCERLQQYMGVSKNRGTPKWMVYNGKPW